VVGLVSLGALGGPGCSGDDDGTESGNSGRLEQTGAICDSADDCFPDVAEGELAGEAICLDRVRDGYCTHDCSGDDDCCAAEGECKTTTKQVCSPFESTGTMMCFLSCESEDIQNADSDADDEQEYCQREAGPDFICRSSGGGSDNRKVCVPADCGVGATCADDADCSADLECITDFDGGYCGKRGCETNAQCPGGSLCVLHDGTGFCYRSCSAASDCGLCRSGDFAASCDDDVVFAEVDTTGSVCVPH